MAKVSLQSIAAEVKKQNVRLSMMNLKILLLEYNSIINRLRMREFKEIALKNIKKMDVEIKGTEWPNEMKGQMNDLASQLEILAKYIKAEDYTRFLPIHNGVKRTLEALEKKCADWIIK